MKKLMPQIKQQVAQAVETAQKAMEQIDMKKVSSKIQQGVQLVKKKIENLKKSSKNNELAITVNNKEASKQISQIQKQIDSLQEKINSRQMKLNVITPKLDEITAKTTNEFTPQGVSSDNPAIQKMVNNSLSTNKEYNSLLVQEEKITQEIKEYNTQLDNAKSKMAQLSQQTNQTATTQNKLGSFFSAFKGKLEQAKISTSGLRNAFSQMPKITQNVTNNIKNMAGKMKQGLGHVLKYATALFSLRSIYSLLSNSAQSWLGSQNAQAQQLSANIEYMKYAMGSVFAPVIEYITNLVYNLMKAIQSLVYAFSGVNIFAKATASSMKSTTGSAKQTNKSLAGVHTEINNIPDNNDSGGSGAVSPSMDLSKIDNTPNSIIDAIKNGSWYEIGETIGQKLNEAMGKIPWNKIKEGAKNIGINTAKFLNGFIAKTDWKQVGNTFAQGVNTVIELGYSFVTTFDWKKFGKSIGDSINGFFKNVDWKKLAETLSETIKGLLDSAFELMKTIDWQALARKLEEFIGNIDWGGIIQKLFRNIGASFAGFGSFIGTLIADAFSGIGKYFSDKIEECGGNIIGGIFKGIIDAIAGVGQWIYDNIFKPFIEGFKSIFGIHSPSTVMQEQGKYIIQGLLNGVKSLINKVTELWNIIKQKAIEIFNNIKNSIANIWDSIKNTAFAVWNGIKSTITNFINMIKNTISDILNGIKNIWGNVWNGIKNFASNIWNGIKNTISNIINGIKSTISNVLNGIKNTWNNIWNGIKNTISNVWNTITSKVRQGAQGAWKAITSIFGNVSNWFKDKFSKAWQAVKNVFSTGGKIFDGIKEGILNGLKAVVNALIRGINKIISVPFNGINWALGKIRDIEILGARPFGWIGTIGVPQIPQLAKGNVAYSPLIAEFGEYSGASNNPEITTPQNVMAETFRDVLSDFEGNNGQPVHVTIQYLGREIFDDTIDYINSKTRRTGKNTIVTVGD